MGLLKDFVDTPVVEDELADAEFAARRVLKELAETGGSDDRISAGELRELGAELPPAIPDVASVRRRAMRVEPCQSSFDAAQGRLTVGMKLTFSEPFEYVSVTLPT